jgi:predicted DNA-binding protein with PD1-like motif
VAYAGYLQHKINITMKINKSSRIKHLIALMCLMFIAITAFSQDYVSPTTPPQTGRSPGVKVKLISENGGTKTYVLIFAAGDEILSGLKEFAIKYKVQCAHLTAIGDASSAKIGWYDKSRKMFKVNIISGFSEITSLIGDIAMYNGNPVVHCHINLAASDGTVRGGHLLEAFVAPTLEVMLTVEPAAIYKKFDPEFGITVIDPDL